MKVHTPWYNHGLGLTNSALFDVSGSLSRHAQSFLVIPRQANGKVLALRAGKRDGAVPRPGPCHPAMEEPVQRTQLDLRMASIVPS